MNEENTQRILFLLNKTSKQSAVLNRHGIDMERFRHMRTNQISAIPVSCWCSTGTDRSATIEASTQTSEFRRVYNQNIKLETPQTSKTTYSQSTCPTRHSFVSFPKSSLHNRSPTDLFMAHENCTPLNLDESAEFDAENFRDDEAEVALLKEREQNILKQ